MVIKTVDLNISNAFALKVLLHLQLTDGNVSVEGHSGIQQVQRERKDQNTEEEQAKERHDVQESLLNENDKEERVFKGLELLDESYKQAKGDRSCCICDTFFIAC